MGTDFSQKPAGLVFALEIRKIEDGRFIVDVDRFESAMPVGVEGDFCADTIEGAIAAALNGVGIAVEVAE